VSSVILINTYTRNWRTGLSKKDTRKYPKPSNIFSKKGKGMNVCVMLKGVKSSLQIAQMNQYTYSIALDP
jgi:hypothetical protein